MRLLFRMLVGVESMKNKTVFYRYRYNTSTAYGDWEYNYLQYDHNISKEDIINLIKSEFIQSQCMWSDLEGYRGFDFEELDKLPSEWIYAKLGQNEEEIARLVQDNRFLDYLLTGVMKY